MTTGAKSLSRWLRILALLVPAALFAGCDEEEFDHTPPSGQGTLVVDNLTGDRVYVYIDGEEVNSVTSDKHQYYDRDPGVYRVVLDGEDTDRAWADDVDVLEGRLTVLEVREHALDYRDFDVREYFED